MLIVIVEILGELFQLWHGIIFQGCCPHRETLMNKFQRMKFGLFNKLSGENGGCPRCYYRFLQRCGFSSVGSCDLSPGPVSPAAGAAAELGFTFETLCFHWLSPLQQEEKP